ncbi:unnamed protein product, partial [marine sediment metagenome]
AGKSSLLNALSGQDSAIVTDIAGTTRDVLKESIHIDGMPLHIIDTAGLHDSKDAIEKEGIRRAIKQIEKADVVIQVIDVTQRENDNHQSFLPGFMKQIEKMPPICTVFNKVDLLQKISTDKADGIYVSAKHGGGIDVLRQYLKGFMGYHSGVEGKFIARRRHVNAIEKAQSILQQGLQQIDQHRAGELLAEDLRQAQLELSQITGEFSSDDLLGRIFSSFCIGK